MTAERYYDATDPRNHPYPCETCGQLVCAPCQQAERARRRAMRPTLPGLERLVRR